MGMDTAEIPQPPQLSRSSPKNDRNHRARDSTFVSPELGLVW